MDVRFPAQSLDRGSAIPGSLGGRAGGGQRGNLRGTARRIPSLHRHLARGDACRHLHQLLPEQILDVPAPQLRSALWGAGLAGILSIALVLRLHGIHDPILDHPGWRQGDTAAIARNFARLRFNPLHPQTDYNGAPPNYVELELQIVPFLSATLYKMFGIHEVFGR